MSRATIRALLEGKLKAMTPALSTAWEHVKFTPKTGVAYQLATLLYSDTQNPSVGNNMYREDGIFNVKLAYPVGKGSRNIEARAELIRSTFNRALTLTSGGVNVIVENTPSIEMLQGEKDRAVMLVKINFYTEIFL